MVSGSISTPTIPVPGLSGWCRPSPGQGEFHQGHPPAYVLVHPPWWLSGALPRPWATTTALSPYRTPECSRRSRSYTDRRGDGVLRSPVVSLTGSGPRPLGRGIEGLPCVAIDPVAVNRLNHRCGCANTRSHGWSSGSLALTHHVLR